MLQHLRHKFLFSLWKWACPKCMSVCGQLCKGELHRIFQQDTPVAFPVLLHHMCKRYGSCIPKGSALLRVFSFLIRPRAFVHACHHHSSQWEFCLLRVNVPPESQGEKEKWKEKELVWRGGGKVLGKSLCLFQPTLITRCLDCLDCNGVFETGKRETAEP